MEPSPLPEAMRMHPVWKQAGQAHVTLNEGLGSIRALRQGIEEILPMLPEKKQAELSLLVSELLNSQEVLCEVLTLLTRTGDTLSGGIPTLVQKPQEHPK